MSLEQTWRWFGPNDPVTLAEAKQAGATGIVSALHHIPAGKVWPKNEIEKRKRMIEAAGLRWSVAESIPVHEDIKKKSGAFRKYIGNYKTSIRNLADCGVNIVCYNFMPVLDWSRTDLRVVFSDRSITTKFEMHVLAAFDIYILRRIGAEASYTNEQIQKAKEFYKKLDANKKKQLIGTILLGFPGSLEAYSLKQLASALHEYNDIGETELRENLSHFLKEIIPVAEECGIFMAIHPDDPPWSLFGLPRIVSTSKDIEYILNAEESPSNGLTFCTGSLGASSENNLVEMAERFAQRIHFIHLRNVSRHNDRDFIEDNHLDGDVDLYGVMKTLVGEQKRRVNEGEKNIRMPLRPDHGHLMLPDQRKKGIYPGYSLFGRMRALAELRGLELGIRRSLEE